MESTATVAARVAAARERQRRRYAGTTWRCNGEVPGPVLRKEWPVARTAMLHLEDALHRGRISARGVDRVLRLAWTLADLAARGRPAGEDVEAALALRTSGALAAAGAPRPRVWAEGIA